MLRKMKTGCQTPFALLLLFGMASYGVSEAAPSQPKYGPAGRPIAVPLSVDSEYFRKSPAPDFWRLIPFYQAQMNGAACSVASVATVLNGLRGSQGLRSEDKLVTQEALLERVNVENWKTRILARGGFRGRRGVPLSRLKPVVEASLREYGLKGYEGVVLRMEAADAKHLALLRGALQENERTADDFLIANFLQSGLTADSDVGHISPIGAYDAERDRVLVLDTDREWYEPYWVSTEALLKAMATADSETRLNRGLLWVRKAPLPSR